MFITEGTLAQNVTPYCEGDRLPIKDDRKRPKNDCGQSEEDQEQRRLADEQQLKRDQTQLEEDLGRLEDSLKTASLGDWLASLQRAFKPPSVKAGQGSQAVNVSALGLPGALQKAEILLMDEPTSALDPATEADYGNTLREFMNRDMTVVIISHRDSLLSNATGS